MLASSYIVSLQLHRFGIASTPQPLRGSLDAVKMRDERESQGDLHDGSPRPRHLLGGLHIPFPTQYFRPSTVVSPAPLGGHPRAIGTFDVCAASRDFSVGRSPGPNMSPSKGITNVHIRVLMPSCDAEGIDRLEQALYAFIQRFDLLHLGTMVCQLSEGRRGECVVPHPAHACTKDGHGQRSALMG